MDAKVEENTGGEDVHPHVLVNENPLSGPFNAVAEFIQSYGWIMLFGLVVCLYIKSKLSPAVQKYKKKVEETIENKKFDPEKAQSQAERMEAARRRMQEQLDAQAALHAEQMKQKEEEKRKQKIEDWDGHVQGKGYRSKFKPKEEETSPSAKFNPLAGDSGASCSWRPAQRRGGGGGGG